MSNLNFIFLLALALVLLLPIAFRFLPGERWQFLAAVPLSRDKYGQWRGLNLTTYGFIFASGTTFAVALFLVLLGALGLPLSTAIGLIAIILAGAVPAARLVARVVEGKKHTFTVGGASFVGLLLMPLAVLLVNRFLVASPAEVVHLLPALAALTTAYIFGEGIGRLACISFGCCYGKPLSDTSPFSQRLWRRWHFVFAGTTKKIAYAANLEGAPVVPIQALTATIYVATGLVGLWLFLAGYFGAAFLLTLSLSQAWRAFSETMRADFRGGGKLSAYQLMAIAALAAGPLVVACLPLTIIPVTPQVQHGLTTLWQPQVLLMLQALWLGVFLYTGCSTVTGALMNFHVHRDRI